MAWPANTKLAGLCWRKLRGTSNIRHAQHNMATVTGLGFTAADADDQFSNERRRSYLRAIEAGATMAEIARREGISGQAVLTLLQHKPKPNRIALYCAAPPEILR